MSAFEMWICDYHSAGGPESDRDVVNEDEAKDRGWVRIERTATDTTSDGSRWNRLEVAHVCGDCVKDPECREWIEDEGYRPYFPEDRERLSAASAQQNQTGGAS